MTGQAVLEFPRHPSPWRIVDRGDDWATRAGWRYALIDATGDVLALDTVPTWNGWGAITGGDTYAEVAAAARRLAHEWGHDPDQTIKETP